jgi:hypothetical protein
MLSVASPSLLHPAPPLPPQKKQVLPDGAPGVKPGGETRTQTWCCGGVEHFDLSYDAFEQLAHPVYGVAMMEYRPVDCDTKAGKPRPGGGLLCISTPDRFAVGRAGAS